MQVTPTSLSDRLRLSLRWRSICALVVSLWLLPSAGLPLAFANDLGTRGATGLALPRFASLKVDRVNLRQGPGTDYPTAWVFRRAGWPVEILREFEGWRQIRDAEGATGWVQGAALSGRRTALVAPWDGKSSGDSKAAAATPQPHPLRGDARDDAGAVAFVEANVMAAITSCDGRWCRVAVGDIRGFIEQARLWGVYPGEAIK